MILFDNDNNHKIEIIFRDVDEGVFLELFIDDIAVAEDPDLLLKYHERDDPPASYILLAKILTLIYQENDL